MIRLRFLIPSIPTSRPSSSDGNFINSCVAAHWNVIGMFCFHADSTRLASPVYFSKNFHNFPADIFRATMLKATKEISPQDIFKLACQSEARARLNAPRDRRYSSLRRSLGVMTFRTKFIVLAFFFSMKIARKLFLLCWRPPTAGKL